MHQFLLEFRGHLRRSPCLDHRLEDYARIYAEEYGDEESVNVIASFMIGDFMEGDAAFNRRRRLSAMDMTPLQNGKL